MIFTMIILELTHIITTSKSTQIIITSKSTQIIIHHKSQTKILLRDVSTLLRRARARAAGTARAGGVRSPFNIPSRERLPLWVQSYWLVMELIES